MSALEHWEALRMVDAYICGIDGILWTEGAD